MGIFDTLCYTMLKIIPLKAVTKREVVAWDIGVEID